jgi:heat shock protein HslJ
MQANKGEGNLANSQWKLVSFGESGSETPVVEGSSITLEFEAEGQAGGSGGCNSYGAKYEMQGNTLTFQEITSTLMACTDEQVMEQEQQYFEALKNAASFEITDDTLTIWYNDGQGRLNFVKATSS